MSNQEEMTNVSKRFKHKWFVSGVCVALIAAIIFTCFYDFFKKEADANRNNPLESMEYMTFMYQNSYILYRDLYNKQNGTNESFLDLYMKPVEGCEISQQEDFLEKLQEFYDNRYEYETAERSDMGGVEGLSERSIEELVNISNYLNNYFEEMEGFYSQLNSNFDFVIEDTITGEYITNLPSPEISLNEQFFYVSFLFDEHGNVSVDGEVRGSDATKIRKNANEVIRNCNIRNLAEAGNHYTEYQKYMKIAMPSNCRITFCIKNTDWQQIMDENDYEYYGFSYVPSFSQHDAYLLTNCGEVYALMLLAVVLVAFFAPGRLTGTPWNEIRICRPAVEILIVLGCFLMSLGSFVIELVCWVSSGEGISRLTAQISHESAAVIVYTINLLVLSVIFFGVWYVGVCAREMREPGIKEYIKKRCVFYQIFPFIKKKLLGVYDAVSHFDVTKDAKKLILKIVLLNAVIVFLISSLWVGGFAVAVIYSIILYVILRKYISDLQKNYSVLLGAVNKIAEGDLNVKIKEDLGVFEPFKPQLIRIQNGFQKAVEAEVKSQRMKAELITNVSHDLKTPLTAIITYINLLKEKTVTDEQRKEYLDTLERKSLRLKVLIEDLFEVSKANSKNMTVNLMDVDICNLLKQVSFEMNDKMAASQLDVRMNLPAQKVILSLDSQKTYRIYENLFGNIAKYALTGTRVYVDIVQNQDEVTVILRNITAEEIHVNAEELTERFVRGDVSRNTEGSGLGLAIAKSFTELQGGKLEIQVDGDLFKVSTIWKLK